MYASIASRVTAPMETLRLVAIRSSLERCSAVNNTCIRWVEHVQMLLCAGQPGTWWCPRPAILRFHVGVAELVDAHG
ncbi:MAG: hypothetical protein ACRDYX_16550 [Egibacteraceae bacterium]